MQEIESMVFQAIGRVTHRKVESLSPELRLREDLMLDSLNFMELEYELQQGGFPEMQIEAMKGQSTIGDVIAFLRTPQ